MKRTYIALAPIRICDLGGWSDTWFAKHGSVLNIAVSPYAECRIEVQEVPEGEERFFFNIDDYGDRYKVDPHDVHFGRHPLLEACVKSMDIPKGLDVEVTLHSAVPGGSSTGTSAAVTVALLGALDCLSTSSRMMLPRELATKAHEVETVLLKQQSGIQDQICSAYGGISFIDMYEYPHSRVSRVPVAPGVLKELDKRLSLIFLGHPHYSTSVHSDVIKGLTETNDGDARLEPLRKTAIAGRDALLAGDLKAFGKVMIQNVEAQANLHPSLVSDNARKIFDIAKRYGADGWKVNGAGGDGGSVTILSNGDDKAQLDMLREINALGNGIRELGIRLDDAGLRIIHG